MAGMATRDVKTGSRTGTERFKTLAQAALNADVTVGQLETVLEGMGATMSDLDKTLNGMDGTLEYFHESLETFNTTLGRIDELAPRLAAVVDQMERIVDRVERLVAAAESLISPLTATDAAVRGVVKTIRERSPF